MSEAPSSGVRVKSIHVRQLFGMYDHDIVLKSARTTIVFGRNGVGKTVIFKLTHALLSGEVAAMLDLLRYPYREFKVVLSNGSEVVAQREDSEGTAKVLLSYWPSATGGARVDVSMDTNLVAALAVRLGRRLPIRSIGPDLWRDDLTGEVMSALDLVARREGWADEEVSKLLATWIASTQTQLPKSLLIQAQRLIQIERVVPHRRNIPMENDTAVRETVLEYSADLKNRIDQTLADYGREAQRRDQTYPQRLFQQASAPLGEGLMGREEIIQSLHAMKRQQAEYQALGILDEQTQNMALNQDQLLTDVYRAAMSVYVHDTQAKLKIVDNLAQRVRLLLDLIGQKFSNKALKIDPKTHDLVVGSTHGKAQRLSVNALSSGEQHQLVLAYDLLFRTQPNTLVLLDEPELSLHVDWQERFLKDLKAVIDLVGFDALLATHSPYIINGHNELTVGLSVQVSADASR
jgi:predicted ATP-binding protein involved in virulence